MNSGIHLGIFDLVGVIMLVLAGTSSIYLQRLKDKSRSSWMLLWFFVCIVLSSIATILTNIGTTWDWAFAPSQDALLILGGVFLVRFAYSYPESDQPGEARWVITLFGVVTFVALAYAVSFAIRYIANLPGDLDENQAFYLLTPIAIILTVFVFFRRSIHWSAQVHRSSETQVIPSNPSVKSLLKPDSRSAFALRNYGLALALSLVPAVVLVEKMALPVVIASFLFNFGAVMAIAALMLTYLNYAPEPVTISAKLVGISLVSILLILGLAGVWVYHTYPGLDEHSLVSTFIALVLLSSLLIILIFPIFFRTALLDPLDKLLNGVKAANEGDLNVRVAVQYDDEIGFLTQSFNHMVKSIHDLTYDIESRALHLEREVSRRTLELIKINQQLEKENEVREKTEAQLNRQLQYQQALAGCSQSLLMAAEDESSQTKVLNRALEHLRSGAQASRAYIFRSFDDPALGACIGMQAEVVAPEVPSQIDNPINQKFPLSALPTSFLKTLSQGEHFGGPVKKLFTNKPGLQESFLNQSPPLLSVLCFPVFDGDGWWGFIGFDDCTTERDWDKIEISMLRTASEMIGSTLQRWVTATQLAETLDLLEMRVEERTAALSRSNILLNEEIRERQQIQRDLEDRLNIEEILAVVSARLLETSKIRENIATSLKELAQVLGVGRIFLAQFDLKSENQVSDYLEWHTPGMSPASSEVVQSFVETFTGLRDRLRSGESIIIQDTTQVPVDLGIDTGALRERNVHSFLLLPIVINQRVQAVLGCSNLPLDSTKVHMNIRALELVTGMLKSLLQREQLIHTLEEQVAERTRQLTTFLDMAMLTDQSQELWDLLQPTLLPITQIAFCDAVGIYILDEKKSALELIAQRGIAIEFLEFLREVELDDELNTWMADSDPYEILGDLDGGPVFPEPFCLPGYSAFFANRLSTGGKSLGLLCCYRVADQPFTLFQTTLLTAFGELLGIIVENHRLRIEAEELAAVEERQRLAREIHDAVSQSVYSLSLFARSANDAVEEGDQDKLSSTLQDIGTTALNAMREMRLLLYQLREIRPDENLRTALDNRFKQVENRLGIQTTSEISSDIILPTHIRHEVWRIMIEALNNIVKHASAAHVNIKISEIDEQLLISVQDDGSGFDPYGRFPGMGLKNMQGRAERLAGHLEITSKPGQGTRIDLQIPMNALEAEGGN